MIALPVALSILAFALAWALGLVAARKLAAKWPAQESVPFHVVSAVILVGALGAVASLHGWPHAAASLGLTAFATYRAAIGARTEGARSRYVLLELYAVYATVSMLALRSLSLLTGTRAAPRLSFAVHDVGSRLLLAPSRWLSVHVPALSERVASSVASAILQGLLEHFAEATALIAFGVAWCTASYFARESMQSPGRNAIPGIGVLGLVWAVSAVIAHSGANAAAWRVVALTPPLAAEGLRALAQVAKRLESRALLVSFGAALLPVAHAWTLVAAIIGWISGTLRPWLLFESPLGGTEPFRVRPRTIALVGTASAAGVATLAGLDYKLLAAETPLLGASPGMCNDVRRIANDREVSFSSNSVRFTIDREETHATPPISSFERARALCARQNKRLCTSDEWYLACVCTYPTESRAGMQLAGNELLAHAVARGRADLERRNAEAAVYGLLDGVSEVVARRRSNGGVCVAGGNNVTADEWMTDCRYRAEITDAALANNAWGFVGVRCCR